MIVENTRNLTEREVVVIANQAGKPIIPPKSILESVRIDSLVALLSSSFSLFGWRTGPCFDNNSGLVFVVSYMYIIRCISNFSAGFSH